MNHRTGARARLHFFFFQAEDGIRDVAVTGVQTCALPISLCYIPATMRPLETIRGFLYGLTGLEFERQTLEMRGSLETIFFVTTLGDMLGLPIIPPVYSLRVLPYAVPHIATWKRRVLREREFSDGQEFHLHGV